jgi:hypothetical protein
MPIEYHPEPEGFRGSGVVFLAWDDVGYWGYWDLEPDGPPTALEECPPSASAAEVVSWGLERTPNVLIRPESDPGRYYWAGQGQPIGKYAALPIGDE